MAKSKKKSSVMRSAQQDYLYCSSHPSSSYPQRPLSRSISPDLQRPTDSPTHPCLARSFVAFADVVNLYQQPRVRAKLQNRGSYPTTSADQSGSSRSNLHHSGILGDPRSSIPQPGGGASDPEAMLGVEATSPSHMSGKASTAGLGAPSSNAPIGPSPPLVHFSNFTASSTCTFLDTDVGTYKDRWRSLGHNTLACISNQHNKRKQQAQTTPTPSGCSPSVDTEAVAKQNPQDMPHGMLGFDPMSAEAAVLGDARIDTSTRKRVKLTTSIPPATPLVVPVPEDADDEPPPMRQYLTRSKAAATSGFLMAYRSLLLAYWSNAAFGSWLFWKASVLLFNSVRLALVAS
ncbi:hypothetical protein D5086_029428 [Populus alba]|uniref:Uncharacterized protein n=1 Tax=Populus alba TaxID=43335 RepID=A0ACC4AUS9_POPAL